VPLTCSENVTQHSEYNYYKFKLAVVLALREHTQTKRSLVSLNEAIDQWLREFGWSFWLKEGMLLLTACVQRFFHRTPDTVIAGAHADDILPVFVRIFPWNFLSKISEFIAFVFSEKLRFMSCLSNVPAPIIEKL